MHTSKSIRLSQDAYERLAAHRRANETSSEVVLHLAGERSLLELADILSDEEAASLRAAVVANDAAANSGRLLAR